MGAVALWRQRGAAMPDGRWTRALLDLAAVAIDRARVVEQIAETRVVAEKEGLRTALLSSRSVKDSRPRDGGSPEPLGRYTRSPSWSSSCACDQLPTTSDRAAVTHPSCTAGRSCDTPPGYAGAVGGPAMLVGCDVTRGLRQPCSSWGSW